MDTLSITLQYLIKYFWIKEDNPRVLIENTMQLRVKCKDLVRIILYKGTAGDITKFAAVLLLRNLSKRLVDESAYCESSS